VNKPHLFRAAIYFGISLILTTLFVLGCPLSIASAKWIMHVFLAIALLRKRRDTFIHGMGMVCLTGSLILTPYVITSWLDISDDPLFFFASLILAVLVMVFRYYAEVIRLNLSLGWWYAWLFTLAVAVGLQLSLVFHLF
jgi:hypothetical protein